jgi:hypothetical protein
VVKINMKGQKMKKLNIGTLDKAKNQKNFSLNLKVYERLFNISNTACGVPVSIPKAIEFLINFYENYENSLDYNSKTNSFNLNLEKYLPMQKKIGRK